MSDSGLENDFSRLESTNSTLEYAFSNLEWPDSNCCYSQSLNGHSQPGMRICQADNWHFRATNAFVSRNPHLSDGMAFLRATKHLSGPQCICQSKHGIVSPTNHLSDQQAFVGGNKCGCQADKCVCQNPKRPVFRAKSGISGQKGSFFRQGMPFLKERMRFPAFRFGQPPPLGHPFPAADSGQYFSRNEG